MNYQRKRLINSMIKKAVEEQIAHVGFNNQPWRDVLRASMYLVAEGVADRITGDIGRERRMTQLFKQPKR